MAGNKTLAREAGVSRAVIYLCPGVECTQSHGVRPWWEPGGCQNEIIEPLRLERTFKIESSHIGRSREWGP